MKWQSYWTRCGKCRGDEREGKESGERHFKSKCQSPYLRGCLKSRGTGFSRSKCRLTPLRFATGASESAIRLQSSCFSDSLLEAGDETVHLIGQRAQRGEARGIRLSLGIDHLA